MKSRQGIWFGAQWLATEAHDRIIRASGLIERKEKFVNALFVGLVLYALLTGELSKRSEPSTMLHHICAGALSALFWVDLVLGRIWDPAPELVEIDVRRWILELSRASRRDQDSILFDMEIRKADQSSAGLVADLLQEAFGAKAISHPERVEISSLITRRNEGSILLLYKAGQVAGCVVAVPLSKQSANQFLRGKICEKHLPGEAILTRGQVRRSCQFVLISAVYLRRRFRTVQGRQALFLALFALTAKLLLASREFVVFCEPVSGNGLRAAKKLGLQMQKARSVNGHPLFKLQYEQRNSLPSDASGTIKIIHNLRDYLKNRKKVPSFLL